jgi:hypothetical protein
VKVWPTVAYLADTHKKNWAFVADRLGQTRSFHTKKQAAEAKLTSACKRSANSRFSVNKSYPRMNAICASWKIVNAENTD